MMTATSKDEYLFMAKISQQSQRFEEMLEYMKDAIKSDPDLQSEELKLFAVAYRKVIGLRRSSWKEINQIEKKQKIVKSNYLSFLRTYKQKIQDQIKKYCDETIQLIDNLLIPGAKTDEAEIFYYKAKGDCYRYISEYASGQIYKIAEEKAQMAYQISIQKIKKSMKILNYFSLSTFLNYSVYYYDIKKDIKKACQMAQQILNNTVDFLDQIQKDQYHDVTMIIQLARDNLTIWSTQHQS